MLAARPLIVVPLKTATVVSARLVGADELPPPEFEPPPASSVAAAVGDAAWLGVVGVVVVAEELRGRQHAERDDDRRDAARDRVRAAAVAARGLRPAAGRRGAAAAS